MRQLLGGMIIAVPVLFGATVAASAQETPTLFFSAEPDQDQDRLTDRFEGVARYLSDALGTSVVYVPAADYDTAVEAFHSNEIQLGWFGGFSGVRARLEVPGSRAIAQGEEDRQFITYVIAHESAGLEASEMFPTAAEDMAFVFGPETSTSGRLMPEHHIRQETGQEPVALFSRVGFAEHHGDTLRLVSDGTYEMGAINSVVYETAVAEGAPEIETVRVIWQTPPYSNYNWTVRGDLDARFGEGFTDRLQDALLVMMDSEMVAVFPRTAFVQAANDDYEAIEDIARTLGLID